jgi:hypothetical protein
MTTPRTPLPGDFGVVSVKGFPGLLIRVGQFLLGDGFWNFEHAFIVLPQDTLIEAEPDGARIVALSEYSRAMADYSQILLTSEQREKIISVAEGLVGTPYSWIDYFSLLLLRLHLRPHWVVTFVASRKSLICSQLVDLCYTEAGVHLFSDGRFSGDVTPADLYRLIS